MYIQVVVWRVKGFFLLPLQLHTSQVMLSKEALQKRGWKQTPSPHGNASSFFFPRLAPGRETKTAH